jgi:hypothetical protein
MYTLFNIFHVKMCIHFLGHYIYIYIYIYITAIVLTHSGSRTVHIYAQNLHRIQRVPTQIFVLFCKSDALKFLLLSFWICGTRKYCLLSEIECYLQVLEFKPIVFI